MCKKMILLRPVGTALAVLALVGLTLVSCSSDEALNKATPDGNRRQTSFRFCPISLQNGRLRGFSRGECIVAKEGFFGRFCPPETPKSILVLRFFSASKGHGNY